MGIPIGSQSPDPNTAKSCKCKETRKIHRTAFAIFLYHLPLTCAPGSTDCLFCRLSSFPAHSFPTQRRLHFQKNPFLPNRWDHRRRSSCLFSLGLSFHQQDLFFSSLPLLPLLRGTQCPLRKQLGSGSGAASKRFPNSTWFDSPKIITGGSFQPGANFLSLLPFLDLHSITFVNKQALSSLIFQCSF